MDKSTMKKAGVGLLWFLGFTAVTNLLVRPALQKAATATNMPKLGQII